MAQKKARRTATRGRTKAAEKTSSRSAKKKSTRKKTAATKKKPARKKTSRTKATSAPSRPARKKAAKKAAPRPRAVASAKTRRAPVSQAVPAPMPAEAESFTPAQMEEDAVVRRVADIFRVLDESEDAPEEMGSQRPNSQFLPAGETAFTMPEEPGLSPAHAGVATCTPPASQPAPPVAAELELPELREVLSGVLDGRAGSAVHRRIVTWIALGFACGFLLGALSVLAF